MTRNGNLIGRQLSKLRVQRELSQAGLAALCQRLGWDLSRDVLARIEVGIRAVTDKEISVLCAALNEPVQELLTPSIVSAFVKTNKAGK